MIGPPAAEQETWTVKCETSLRSGKLGAKFFDKLESRFKTKEDCLNIWSGSGILSVQDSTPLDGSQGQVSAPTYLTLKMVLKSCYQGCALGDIRTRCDYAHARVYYWFTADFLLLSPVFFLILKAGVGGAGGSLDEVWRACLSRIQWPAFLTVL